MKPLLFIIAAAAVICAAELNVQVEGIVDNREYFDTLESPGTLFGLRETGTASFGSELHSLTAGLIWFQEFGADISDWPAAPVIYYRYGGEKGGRLLFGSFPRNDSILYSKLFFDERYRCSRPQIEGFDFQYTFEKGKISALVDWDSRQSAVKPEHFFFSLSGKEKFGLFSMEQYLLYRHLAGRDVNPHDPVGENGGAHMVFSVESNSVPHLDTLKGSAEFLGTYDRLNRDDPWNTPIGAQGSARIIFHKLGVGVKGYKGIRKSLYYHQLEQGAAFYGASQFSEFDFCFYPIQKPNISMKFHWITTFVCGEVENQQQFVLAGSFRKKLEKAGRE